MKAIKQFNQPDTHLVISGYPEQGHCGKNYGIAWYTKETVKPLAKKKNARFVILAETNDNNDPKVYQDGKILVLRVFDQRNPTLYPRILKWLAVFNRIKRVYVHSEFCANGGLKNLVLLIPFLLLIRLTGRKITFFAHNIVTDVNSIAPHLNFKKKSLTVRGLNSGIKVYYTFLGLITERIVAMDEVVKQRLAQFINPEKIIGVPMWVKQKSSRLSQKQAKEKLGLKPNECLLLYFGFVTWYKGADWLVKAFSVLAEKNKFKNYYLILAGGPASSLKDKQYYQKFYQRLVKLAEKEKKIRITGFVQEKDIGLYFKAADLVIFPYRGLLGSSGTLAHALCYKKPFIISNKMAIIAKNTDLQAGLVKCGLQLNDLSFKLNIPSLEKRLSKIQDKRLLTKLKKLSNLLACERDFDKWLNSYYNQIYARPREGKRDVKNIKFLARLLYQPAIK